MFGVALLAQVVGAGDTARMRVFGRLRTLGILLAHRARVSTQIQPLRPHFLAPHLEVGEEWRPVFVDQLALEARRLCERDFDAVQADGVETRQQDRCHGRFLALPALRQIDRRCRHRLAHRWRAW